MSALRWGRGAAGLGRALVPAGRSGLSAEQGAHRGMGGFRENSSASPCERDPQKDWGHVELLEVLKARVRQLQAESVSEVTVKRVDVARLPEGGGSDARLTPKPQEFSSHWAKKLDMEKTVMAKHKKCLEKKLQKPTWKKKALRVQPRLQNLQLSGHLYQWARGGPANPWEEQILCEVPKTLGQERLRGAADKGPETKLSSHQRKLLGFLEGCLLTDQLPLAHHVLVTQYGNFRRRHSLTLDMYNMVMLGWARKGSLKELVYVFFMVKDAGLTPDLLSYAAALLCMGRLDQDARTIESCLKQMARDQLQLPALFSVQALSKEEREVLLVAVRKVQPSFSPPPPPSPQANSCPLLSDIYGQDSTVSYPKLHLPLKDLEDLFQQQLRVELATTVQVQSVEKAPELTSEVQQARKTLQSLRAQWEETLCQKLQEVKAEMARVAFAGRPTLYPHLCLLSEREMAQMLLQVLQVLPPQGQSLIQLAQELGTRTFNRQAVQRKQREGAARALRLRYSEYLRLLACDTQVEASYLPRQYWEALGGPDGSPRPEQPWPLHMLVELGKHLAEVLVQAVHMPRSLGAPAGSEQLIPVLYHVYSFRSFRQIGFVKPHPAFSQLLATAGEATLTFEATEVPMLCPPLPWTSPHTGAFLLSPAKLMRADEGAQQHQQGLERCPPATLHGAMDALTQLGNCAWRVNGRILDLVLAVFHDRGSSRLGVPPPASEAPRPPARPPVAGTSPARLAELRREAARCLKEARELRGLRADALYRLSLAQHLRHRGAFWLPHNMDFRGRTYPCPPHLSHLGNDLARALLEFAQGRPLGPRGLDWLKMHLVNLTGLKKRESLQARLAFADQMLDEVLDSADRPMTGRKWWMEADEPWQALACCMEIARALRSADPARFVSHFPVHQDGSCNGLQHYAALGRDSVGAASVNLAPSDLPQDVYSGVAAQVEVFRKRDAAQGVHVAQALGGFVTRKVVKQTVMTVVYGVTRYGGRLQIEKRLRELPDFPQELVWEASRYLVQQVFNSLQEMFCATRSIQHWLTESARLISLLGFAVEWVTPLGVPVIQPYHRASKLLICGGLQSVSFNQSTDSSQLPNTMKQKNGFPPNFIHSLDSTHMMLTALHCYQKGLTFVSVHDCFWTHAADVSVMNQVCREQFVRLHSQPILQDLSRFLVKRFCATPSPQQPSKTMLASKLVQTLLAVPKTGTFNLEQVKLSKYFFS